MSYKKYILNLLCALSLGLSAENVTDNNNNNNNNNKTLTKKSVLQKISTCGQWLYISCAFIYQSKNMWQSYFNTPVLPLDPIPQSVINAVTSYGYKVTDFTFQKAPLLRLNAFVHADKIVIGKYLVERCDKYLEFIIGHEIAHYVNNDFIKRCAFIASLILAQIAFHKYIQYAKQKYNAMDNPVLYKFIQHGDAINTFLNKNPLLRSFLITFPTLCYTNYQEKQADILSAIQTGKALEGAEFFQKMNILEDKMYEQKGILAEHIPVLKAIESAFSSHPAHLERVRYLQEFALKNRVPIK